MSAVWTFKLEKYFNIRQSLFGSTINQETFKNLAFPSINMEALLQDTEHNTKSLKAEAILCEEKTPSADITLHF